jgi:hypothetical protein
VTKTFARNAVRRDIKFGKLGMIPLGVLKDGSFVWDLVFGAWNFRDFC